MSIQDAVGILRRAEAEIQQLVGRAAGEGNYTAVLRLTEWAQTLSGLIAGATPAPARPLDEAGGRPKMFKRIAVDREYPRFVRRGDSLVKLAWSKAERKEYQHKAQLGVLKPLLMGLEKAGARGQIFPLDAALTEMKDTNVPDYQLYCWIGWLRKAGLIEQHGRQGYSLPAPGTLEERARQLWQDTPEG